MKKILLCGHRSFAAKGLDDLLRAKGHEVICFTRGAVGMDGNTVLGPVAEIDLNPHLQRPFDTVINYILLKDENIDANVAFTRALLRLCTRVKAAHLIHVSSISVFKATEKIIHEDAAVETDVNQKGAYASLKVATENDIVANLPEGLALSLLRPGFVLGEGLLDPIVGTGARSPFNSLIVLGNADSHIPLVSRNQLNDAVATIAVTPPAGTERLLLADRHSPTRRDYLEACNSLLGAGARTDSIPPAVWMAAAFAGEAVTRAIGQSGMKVLTKISSLCRYQEFDSRRTEERLGISFSLNWKELLSRSLDQQKTDVVPLLPLQAQPVFDPPEVSFVGYGRIVGQKHLPALKKLLFRGEIVPYDLKVGVDAEGRRIKEVSQTSFAPKGVVVVTSPGPAHSAAIDLLKNHEGPILVEKPLCTDNGELERWISLESGRKSPVIVCHNYRYKQNVLQMMEHLQKFNPGRLIHVSMTFQSPPVPNDGAPWLRNERRARTLLMDYALHFIDLACIFGDGEGAVSDVAYNLDENGHTAAFNANVRYANCTVALLARQGFIPRTARIVYTFQNYAVSLGFFPDTFVAHMTSDGFGIHAIESVASLRATAEKVIDKLSKKDSDLSHVRVYQEMMTAQALRQSVLSVSSLQRIYRVLFSLGRMIYETPNKAH